MNTRARKLSQIQTCSPSNVSKVTKSSSNASGLVLAVSKREKFPFLPV
jgi:hypothetical protein